MPGEVIERKCPPIIEREQNLFVCCGLILHRIPKKEGNPIVQVASLFNQLLQHFPRIEFGALVKKHNAERCAKGFSCWTQLVSMLFCQLAHADSLREISEYKAFLAERRIKIAARLNEYLGTLFNAYIHAGNRINTIDKNSCPAIG